MAPEGGIEKSSAMHPEEDEKALGERMGATVHGAVTALMLNIADSIGLFPALRDIGPCTSEALAKHMNLNERWVRELLYQQVGASVNAGVTAAQLIANLEDTLGLNRFSGVITRNRQYRCIDKSWPVNLPFVVA